MPSLLLCPFLIQVSHCLLLFLHVYSSRNVRHTSGKTVQKLYTHKRENEPRRTVIVSGIIPPLCSTVFLCCTLDAMFLSFSNAAHE